MGRKPWEAAGHPELPTAKVNPAYFLAGALAAGAALLVVEAPVASFLTCFLCFFVFAGAVAALSVVESVFGVAGLSACAAKVRAAARAVPNIKLVMRFMILFLLGGAFHRPSICETWGQINQV
jgi:hypothetical protein